MSPKGDKGVVKPLRYHSRSVQCTALVRPVTGTPGGIYLQKAFGPQLPGDVRRVRPAALAPYGRLSERFHNRLLVLFKAFVDIASVLVERTLFIL